MRSKTFQLGLLTSLSVFVPSDAHLGKLINNELGLASNIVGGILGGHKKPSGGATNEHFSVSVGLGGGLLHPAGLNRAYDGLSGESMSKGHQVQNSNVVYGGANNRVNTVNTGLTGRYATGGLHNKGNLQSQKTKSVYGSSLRSGTPTATVLIGGFGTLTGRSNNGGYNGQNTDVLNRHSIKSDNFIDTGLTAGYGTLSGGLNRRRSQIQRTEVSNGGSVGSGNLDATSLTGGYGSSTGGSSNGRYQNQKTDIIIGGSVDSVNSAATDLTRGSQVHNSDLTRGSQVHNSDLTRGSQFHNPDVVKAGSIIGDSFEAIGLANAYNSFSGKSQKGRALVKEFDRINVDSIREGSDLSSTISTGKYGSLTGGPKNVRSQMKNLDRGVTSGVPESTGLTKELSELSSETIIKSIQTKKTNYEYRTSVSSESKNLGYISNDLGGLTVQKPSGGGGILCNNPSL